MAESYRRKKSKTSANNGKKKRKSKRIDEREAAGGKPNEARGSHMARGDPFQSVASLAWSWFAELILSSINRHRRPFDRTWPVACTVVCKCKGCGVVDWHGTTVPVNISNRVWNQICWPVPRCPPPRKRRTITKNKTRRRFLGAFALQTSFVLTLVRTVFWLVAMQWIIAETNINLVPSVSRRGNKRACTWWSSVCPSGRVFQYTRRFIYTRRLVPISPRWASVVVVWDFRLFSSQSDTILVVLFFFFCFHGGWRTCWNSCM